MARTDDANLTLSNVDLSACRFTGTYNLDRLRIERRDPFAYGPRGWRAGWSWPPLWRWTARRAIAEEHRWRADYEVRIRKEGWYSTECRPQTWDFEDDGRPAQAEEASTRANDVEALNRSLRKGREDLKDEPGAADFYYGEMEMHRRGTHSSVERATLFGYWLVSGYGLRASRPDHAYYMEPGHEPVYAAGTEVVEFSPTDELNEMIAQVLKNVARSSRRSPSW